jgi:hypothetical protein
MNEGFRQELLFFISSDFVNPASGIKPLPGVGMLAISGFRPLDA